MHKDKVGKGSWLQGTQETDTLKIAFKFFLLKIVEKRLANWENMTATFQNLALYFKYKRRLSGVMHSLFY